MAEPLHFDLVSPARLLMSEQVEHVVVPGAEGYFTVLPHHAPFMTTLKPGVVEIKELSGTVRKIYVRGGFADVSAEGLTILAEEAFPIAEVDAALLAQQIRDAEEDLADTVDEMKRTAAAKQLNDLKDVQRWLLPA